MDTCSYNLDETELRFAEIASVRQTLKYLNDIRSLHRSDNRGKSKDGTWMDLGKVPSKIYWSDWFQERFPANMPFEDRQREIFRFFKANPKLLCVDKA